MSERFQFLCMKYLDGSLNSQEVAELTQLVKENKIYQKDFAEMMVQNAAIRNVLGSQSEMENAVKETGKLRPFKSSRKYKSTRFQTNQSKPSPWPILILAAMVFIGVAIPMLVFKKTLDESKQVTQTKPIAKTEPIITTEPLTQEKPVIAAVKIKVVEVVGEVSKTKENNKEALLIGSSIEVGDQVSTGFNSYVILHTPAKSVIVLNENTNIEWKNDNIALLKGDIYANIKKKDIPSVYKFSTPENTINITGTTFEWGYNHKNRNSVLKVKEGVVEFNQKGEKKTVKKNQMIVSSEFANGPVTISGESIALWLKYFEFFTTGVLHYIDEFKTEDFSKFWTIQTTQRKDTSSPESGLTCIGKNQKIELISKDIVLDGANPLVFIFKSSSIKAVGSFEYGYEVWNEKEIVINQGYLVTQIDETTCHIKEVRNFGDEEKLKDEVLKPTKDNSGVVVSENLPSIAFNFSLSPTIKKVKEKISYQKGVMLSDVAIGAEFKLVKVKFYLKTINEGSKAQWTFDLFAVARDNESTKKVLK